MEETKKNIGIIGAGRPVRHITNSLAKRIELIADSIPPNARLDEKVIIVARELKRGRASQLITAMNQASQPGGPEDYESNQPD